MIDFTTKEVKYLRDPFYSGKTIDGCRIHLEEKYLDGMEGLRFLIAKLKNSNR